jgi:hypothetical protein
MKYLILLICTISLIGCTGSRTRINYGADLAVYEASPQWMFDHMPPGTPRGASRFYGYYDPTDGSITLNEQNTKWTAVRIFNHEFTLHAIPHQKPVDATELLLRYHSPSFDFILHPEQRDRLLAMSVAKQAAKDNK